MTDRCPGSNLTADDQREIERFAGFLCDVADVTDETEKRRIYLEHYPEYAHGET